MDGNRIHELLADYVRGSLGPEETARVDEALGSSEPLRAECEKLRAYYAAMNELGSVRAPDDFLDKVHARIERGGVVRRMAKRLFLPLPLKLPIELAGLAVTAVLVLIVYRPFEKGSVPPLVFESERTVEQTLKRSEERRGDAEKRRSGDVETREEKRPGDANSEMVGEHENAETRGRGDAEAHGSREVGRRQRDVARDRGKPKESEAASGEEPASRESEAGGGHEAGTAEEVPRTEAVQAEKEQALSFAAEQSAPASTYYDDVSPAPRAKPERTESLPALKKSAPGSSRRGDAAVMSLAEPLPVLEGGEAESEPSPTMVESLSESPAALGRADNAPPPVVSLRLRATQDRQESVSRAPRRSRAKAKAPRSPALSAPSQPGATRPDPRLRLEQVLRDHNAEFGWEEDAAGGTRRYTVMVSSQRLEELRTALDMLGVLKDEELARLDTGSGDVVEFVLDVTVD